MPSLIETAIAVRQHRKLLEDRPMFCSLGPPEAFSDELATVRDVFDFVAAKQADPRALAAAANSLYEGHARAARLRDAARYGGPSIRPGTRLRDAAR